MNEKDIIKIIKREIVNITNTGKAPNSLPKWLYYLDHHLSYRLTASLTVAAKIKNRMRVFYGEYNLKNKTHSLFIDGVPY